jgi:hypothetical protein
MSNWFFFIIEVNTVVISIPLVGGGYVIGIKSKWDVGMVW